jgi:hypothetical protein
VSLQVELSGRLDAGSVVGDLTTAAGAALGEMDAITLPDLGADFATAGGLSDAINFSDVEQLVTQLVAELGPLADNLPLPANALATVQAVVDFAQQLNTVDVIGEIQSLSGDIDTQLGASGDFLGQLQGVSDLLADRPSLAGLRELLVSLTRLTGGTLDANDLQVPELVPALLAAFRGAGALISLHTLLAEAQRLAAVVDGQLDPDAIASGNDLVELQLGLTTTQPLAGMLADLDVGNAAEVAAAKQAVENVGEAVQALTRGVAQGMAFGEATLVHLDAAGLKTAVSGATAALDGIDLAPLRNTVNALVQRLQALLPDDFASMTPPAATIEDWLQLAEDEVATVVARIDATDMAALYQPLTDGISAVMALPQELVQALEALRLSISDALGAVESAVRAIPLADIADAINRVLEPINAALDFLTGLIADIQAALEAAIALLVDSLGSAEDAVDAVKSALDALFADAQEFLDALDLDAVIGTVSDQINTFAETLSAADMSPYFDTVSDAIGTAASVVDKVPFDLLPDSMEQDVVDVVQPIKQTDVTAVQRDIESLLQIAEDGTFALRPELETALAGVQAKFDELLAALREHDPRALTEDLDRELDALGARIGDLVPTVALQPVEAALETLRSAVGGFDLDGALTPLRQAFDQVLEVVDGFDPTALIAPLEAELAAAREGVFTPLRIDTWADLLTDLRTQALALVDPLDPAQLQPQLETLLTEIESQADNLPDIDLGFVFGSVFSAVGGGARAPSFAALLDWLEGSSGTEQLAGMASAAAASIESARSSVQAVDPGAIVLGLKGPLDSVRAAIAALPPGPQRDTLQACAKRLDVEAALAGFAAQRSTYLTGLSAANGCMTELANTGLSQVDVGVAALRDVLAPLDQPAEFGRNLLRTFGITDLQLGVSGIVRQVLQTADAARLAGIATPIFTALKGRVTELLDGLLDPLLSAITDLEGLKDAVSLESVIADLSAIHAAVRAQVAGLHPDVLLGESLSTFAATQAQIVAFDPLGPIDDGLTAIRDTSTRVLDKLDSQVILQRPIAIYDSVLDTVGGLDIQALLGPLLTTLDDLSSKVEKGLDDTTSSFIRLQDALPDQVGSTSISASASAG